MGRNKPKIWTVQRLRENLEARQQLLERLLVEVLDSSSKDKDEIVH